MSFKQPLFLNLLGDATLFVEQPVQTGAGHADQSAKGFWPQGRIPQMSADDLPYPFHAAEIYLPLGDIDALSGWRDRGGDYRGDRFGKLWKVRLCQGREMPLERNHIVAEYVTQWRVQGRAECGIEQWSDFGECVPRQDQLDPVDMGAFVDEFLPERP
jgi:hypothetical protein